MAVLRDRGHDVVLRRAGKTRINTLGVLGTWVLDPQLQEVNSTHFHKRQHRTVLLVGDFPSTIIELDIISIAKTIKSIYQIFCSLALIGMS